MKQEGKGKQRPDTQDRRPKGVMFAEVGQTGWNRIRSIHKHKGNRTEGDFHHLHSKFADPEDAA